MTSRSAGIGLAESTSYDRYVRAEWALFSDDAKRAQVASEILSETDVQRVLDVGCGAGQELRPFVARTGVLGVGIDLAADAGRAGQELFATELPGSRVAFMRAGAEALPFAGAAFDVVICRLALPYTSNRAALAEMRRVLRPGGVLLLTFHHARYYLLKLREAVETRQPLAAVHACRVLAAGALYHLTGRQPRNRLTGRETFQTRWLLARELRRVGLAVRSELAGSPAAAPSLVIERSERGSV